MSKLSTSGDNFVSLDLIVTRKTPVMQKVSSDGTYQGRFSLDVLVLEQQQLPSTPKEVTFVFEGMHVAWFPLLVSGTVWSITGVLPSTNGHILVTNDMCFHQVVGWL